MSIWDELVPKDLSTATQAPPVKTDWDKVLETSAVEPINTNLPPAPKWFNVIEPLKQREETAKGIGEFLTAAAGRFDKSMAFLFNQMDYVQTSLGDALNQILIGKEAANGIKEIRNKYGVDLTDVPGQMPHIRPFKALADATDWAAAPAKELPNTLIGNITGGLADIGPQIIAASVAPELSALKVWGMSGKFATSLGIQGLIQGTQNAEGGTTLQKLTTPVLRSLEQGMTGAVYEMMGPLSSKLGGKLANKFIPEVKSISQLRSKMLIGNTGTTSFNALMFGGYGTLNEFLEKGDTSWKTFASNVGIGIGLGAREVGKGLWAKGINTFVAAPKDLVDRVAKSDVSSEELITHAQEKVKSVESDKSKNPEGDMSSALLSVNTGLLKGVVEEIKDNPADVIKSVEESSFEQSVKDHIIDKIQETSANMNPTVVESKPYSDELKKIDDQIQANEDNPYLGSVDKELQKASMAERRKTLTENITRIYDKHKVLTPEEKIAAENKSKEDLKQARIAETKAVGMADEFTQQGEQIADAFGGRFESRIKTPESTVAKTTRENVEVSGVGDILGGAIIVPDMKSFKDISKQLKKEGYSISNKRVGNKETGWRGVVAIKTENGIGQEIQLHTEQTWEAQKKAEEFRYKYQKEGIPPVVEPIQKDIQKDVIDPSLSGMTDTQTGRILISPTEGGIKFKDPTTPDYTEIKSPEDAQKVKNEATVNLEKVNTELQKREETKKSDVPFKIFGNTYVTKEDFIQGLKDTFGGNNFDTEVLMSDDIKFDKSISLSEVMKVVDEVTPKSHETVSIPIELQSSSELQAMPSFYEARQRIADNAIKFLGEGKYSAEDQVKVHNEFGGSTFTLGGESMAGRQGKAAVSIFPDRTETISGRDVTPKDLKDFVKKNKDILKGNEDTLSVGTWKNDKGDTELDIVATPSLKKAIEFGKKYNQKAIFDLGKMEEVSTGGTGGGEEFKKIPIEERLKEVRGETSRDQYEAAMTESRRLYEEAYKGLEDINLEGNIAQTPAQRKAKELGLSTVVQKELSKAWTETKKKVVGELKGKNEEVKQAFKDFIKGMPRLAKLNIKLQARMLNKVNAIDFTKPSSLPKAINYFDKIVNNATWRYNEARAEQALNILDVKSSEADLTKKVGGVAKNKKGPTGLPLWDELKSIRNDMLTKDWATGQEEIQKTYDKIAEEGRLFPNIDEFNKITRLNFYGALNATNRAESDQLQGLARDLMSIRKQGISEAAARKMVMDAQDAELHQAQLAVLTGNGKKPVELDNRYTQNQRDSAWKRFKALFDWPGSSSFGSHLDFLSQNDKTSKPGESLLNQSLEEPLWHANLQNYDDIRGLHNEINDKFSEIWKTPKGRKSHDLSKKNTSTIHTIKYKNIAGIEESLDITTNQAIKVYMELQDPSLEKSHEVGYYKRNGELTSLGRGIIDVLTPEAKAWGDWQLNEFYPKMRELLNPVYREFNGMDMPFGDVYSPIFVDTNKNVADNDLLSRQNFMTGIKNGSLIARVRHDKPLRLMDADKVLESYVSNMMYWKNYTEPLHLLSSFVHDPAIRAAITQNFTNGKDHLAYLEKDIDNLMRKPTDQWMTTSVLRKIRNNVLLSSLMAKIPIGINQVASSLAFAEYIPVKEIPKYSIESLTHWMGDKGNVALAKKLWNTSYIQQRYGQGWDNVLTEIMKSDFQGVGGKGSRADWRNKLMTPLSTGDFSAILLGGIPVYRYTYDQALKKYGGNERMAEIEALHAFAKASDETQQSGLDINLSHIQKDNEFTKSMTMYKSANFQYQRKVSEAFRGLVHDRGTWQRNVKTLALYHVVLPMVYQWFANGFKWNTEDELQAGVLGNLNDLFVAGDMIDGVLNIVRGDPWKKYNVSPILGSWEDIVQTTTHLMKVKKTEAQVTKGIPKELIPQVLAEAEKMHLYDMNFLELGKALKYGSKVMGAAFGLPIPGITAVGTGIYDVATGKETGNLKTKVMRILGKSAYAGKNAADDSTLTPEQIDKLIEEAQKSIPGPIKPKSKEILKNKQIPEF